MHFACAVGCEGRVVSVDLGGREHVRIVFGAVQGVEESARLLLCLFQQGANAATYSPALPSLTATRATIAKRRVTGSSFAACLP
jgi:hypothetical protein